MQRLRLLIGVLSILCCVTAQAGGDEIIKLDRPDKAPLFYIATTPDADTKVGAILFAGSQGQLHLAAATDMHNPPDLSNFLIRSRKLFSAHGIATASFDPSADSGALDDSTRRSALHADEVAQVLADFKHRFGLNKIYLIGTSRGTISVAYLALALHSSIDGVVLTSTAFEANRRGTGLSGFDFSKIQVPLLFVHHRHDACKVTPPQDAERLQGTYTVILIDGESGSGDECGPFSAHGYIGKEQETVTAISDWILAHAAQGKP